MTLSVNITPLRPEFNVCGQISVADVAVLAQRGFKSIVNNRPDGEDGPRQPRSAEIEAEAKAHGMHYVHFPVSSPMVTPAQVEAYRLACADLPHPLVAFCRTGGRASAFFQACDGQVGCPA
jgi:uncharacterized protein (TIGR01244 family)